MTTVDLPNPRQAPAWMAEAACAGVDPELFHPGRAAVLGCSDRTVGRICQAVGLPSHRQPGRRRDGGS